MALLVSALQIVAKIKELPPDYAEHVHITGIPTREAGGIAEVNSFSDPTQETPYIVHIKRAEVESNLNVTCTCPATKLCMHVVAFYTVQKGIKPPESTLPSAPDKVDEEDKGKADEAKQEASKEIEEAMPHLISMARAIARAVELSRKGREAAAETAKALDELDRAYIKAMKEIEK